MTIHNAVQTNNRILNNQDHKTITLEQMMTTVKENGNFTMPQHDQLLALLMKYQHHPTKQPGRCKNLNVYIVTKMPNSGTLQQTPFVLCSHFREQIQEMIRDGILEESYSTYAD
jgi:hypothetical protein